MEPTVDKDQVIAALIESTDILQNESITLKASNRLLRKVNSILRQTITSLQNQVAVAQANDDLFKRFCSGDFDAKSDVTPEGGLPGGVTPVEPTA